MRNQTVYKTFTAAIPTETVLVISISNKKQEAISLVCRLIGSTKVSAEREMALFFKPEEICDWEDGNAQWF